MGGIGVTHLSDLEDVNAIAGGLLRDLAFAQTSAQKAFGYKRAAAAVLGLDEPLTALVQRDGTLRRIPGIGPASTRVILEVLETGTSAIVERAIESSSRAADIRRRRGLRAHFLSRAAVRRALAASSLGGPDILDYRGDLQMHSEWSDGVATLHDITEACIARGYSYAAVTDHSHGLKIAGGMSMVDAVAQHEEIDRINADYGQREIDGDPSRQDLDYTLAACARDAGCLFALDSDAHSTSQLRYVETAVAHARLAAIPSERIVNCWPTDRLLGWLRHA